LSLLQAAFGDQQAWRAWRTVHSLDDADYAQQVLLPSVFKTQPALDEPDRSRLQGVYRYHWARNQLLLRTTVGLLAGLEAAGVQALVLGELGQILTVTHDPGLCPTRAIELCLSRRFEPPGWKRTGRQIWTNSSGQHLILHPSPSKPYWENSVTISLAGARALAPAHALLQLCRDGWGGHRPGWARDALALLRLPFDWDGFLQETEALKMVPMVLWALPRLQPVLARPDLHARVLQLPADWIDRLCFGLGNGMLWDYLHARPVGFCEFLNHRWGLDHNRQLPAELWRRLRVQALRRSSAARTSRA
jgi:hypothetical protein